MNEAVITVSYETKFTTLTHRSVSYADSYKHPKSVAESFERAADEAANFVSNLLAHKYGRQEPDDPPAVRRRLSNRQKVELCQQIIDTGGWTSKQVLDKIREALKR